MKHFCYYLFLSCLSVSGSLCAQKLPTINGIDRVLINRKDTIFEFYAKQPVGKLNGCREKMYYWYKSDTILVTRGGFGERVLSGSYNVFYPRGNLKEKGQFTNGLKEGEWINWYANGEIQSVGQWKKGEKDGVFIEYSSLGTKVASVKYKHGLQEGMQQRKTNNGKWDTTYFKRGFIIERDTAPGQKKGH